jgi:hypothetical protein
MVTNEINQIAVAWQGICFKLTEGNKMSMLTIREIISVLKNLGISTRSELKTYLKEYKAYYILSNMNSLITDRPNTLKCTQIKSLSSESSNTKSDVYMQYAFCNRKRRK